jgi:hypothetical protein
LIGHDFDFIKNIKQMQKDFVLKEVEIEEKYRKEL